MEPPWLEACPKDLSKWTNLIDALSVLALRTSALESLLEVLTPPLTIFPEPERHLQVTATCILKCLALLCSTF